MKVIFLDFDGVLNSRRYLADNNIYGIGIDPSRMVLLKEIVDATDAEIVLTTSWRQYWDWDESKCDEIGMEINEIFGSCGIEIYSKTKSSWEGREAEIEDWLLMNPEVESFVVLDDMMLDAKFLRDRFVHTSNYKNGLDEDDVAKAIEILNG